MAMPNSLFGRILCCSLAAFLERGASLKPNFRCWVIARAEGRSKG